MRRTIKFAWPVLFLMLGGSPAFALNKCVDSFGKVSYSDRPCDAGQVERGVNLSGAARYRQQESVSDSSARSERGAGATDGTSSDRLASMKAYVAAGERNRKIDDLKVAIRNEERHLDRLQSQMDLELSRLKVDGERANNNLAGATWQTSIATEMGAITQKYEIKMKVVADRTDRLRSQLASLERDR